MADFDDDRSDTMDVFDERSQPKTAIATAPLSIFSAGTDRVFGAQQVAVHRDETRVLAKIRTFAAAAGTDWFYRFPVKKKVKDEKTGREVWVDDYIEGPSIKLANDVARLYGNCDIDTRVMDMGDNWVIYARFTDFETGYSMTRPFQQRKGQKAMKTDNARALDIAFQIGVSKAIRNVVVNALQTFADFGMDEARNSLIEKIGKNIDVHRKRIVDRAAESGIDIARIERVFGRATKDWLAPDIAKIIAMFRAINDGMATIEETFPPIRIDVSNPLSDEPDAAETTTATAVKEPDATGAARSAQPATVGTGRSDASPPRDEGRPSAVKESGAGNASSGEGAGRSKVEPPPADGRPDAEDEEEAEAMEMAEKAKGGKDASPGHAQSATTQSAPAATAATANPTSAASAGGAASTKAAQPSGSVALDVGSPTAAASPTEAKPKTPDEYDNYLDRRLAEATSFTVCKAIWPGDRSLRASIVNMTTERIDTAKARWSQRLAELEGGGT